MICGMTHRTRSFGSIFTILLSALLAGTGYSQSLDVWIGTSRNQASQGIYHCTLDATKGRLSPTSLAAEISGPGFLAMHPDRNTLYAVGALGGKPCTASYRVTGKGSSAQLKLLNSKESGDGGSSHVCVDKTGRTLITAQYGGGSVSVYSLNKDGSIKARTQTIEHEGGSNVAGRRQASPHPHWAGVSPDNRFVFVPDLGLDRVMIYRLDAANSKITAHGSAVLPPGAGPRHMKFHPSGKWVYVLNEIHVSVTTFDYDAKNGTMTAKETIAAVPAVELEKEKAKSASEIRVHPNGQFVYSANRGHDTVTAYRVNQKTGALQVIEREFVRGATPRNFNLDPSGKWLLAAGQDSHTLAAFEVDQVSGELAYNRSVVNAPAPICVLFGPE
ncbi:MAG: 6-phosphogluconolactonase [Limisphaerales bacterium]|jgi:6-phosphogluconolactonase